MRRCVSQRARALPRRVAGRYRDAQVGLTRAGLRSRRPLARPAGLPAPAHRAHRRAALRASAGAAQAGRRVKRIAAALAGAGLLALLLAPDALAQGLVGKQDLPIPRWLFSWAAAIVLVISF